MYHKDLESRKAKIETRSINFWVGCRAVELDQLVDWLSTQISSFFVGKQKPSMLLLVGLGGIFSAGKISYSYRVAQVPTP